MKTIKAKILTIDVPTQTGKIFNKETTEKIVADFKNRAFKVYCLEGFHYETVINMNYVVGECVDLFIEDNDLFAKAELFKDLDNIENRKYHLTGTGVIDKNYVITNYDLIYISIE